MAAIRIALAGKTELRFWFFLWFFLLDSLGESALLS
jgi:hypothetical protein